MARDLGLLDGASSTSSTARSGQSHLALDSVASTLWFDTRPS
jgi:hypothetical protein